MCLDAEDVVRPKVPIMLDNPTLHQRNMWDPQFPTAVKNEKNSQAQPTVALQSGSVYVQCNYGRQGNLPQELWRDYAQ